MAKGPDWATGKPVFLTKPEEQVRQEYERALHYDHGYPREVLDIEVPIHRGSKSGEKADIVLYRTADPDKRDQAADILGIVECKRKARSDGVEQLTSYMTATACLWGAWTNGKELEVLYKDPATGTVSRDRLFQVPHHGQPIESIGAHQFSDLRPAHNLKLTFRRLLNELYSNTNISRREKLGNEMVKLLFCKLQDEKFSVDSVIPRFRVGFADHTNGFRAVRARIDELFGEVKEGLAGEGVFDEHARIVLENRSVAYVVGELQGYSLTQTEEDTVGSAFEVFAESKFAGEKGEFFTPREVVKTAVQIIDPQPGETMIDPACGSGGFLICALQHVWQRMEAHPRWRRLTPRKLDDAKRQLARETVYGLDKESDLVRIAKAYMAIIGDGKSRMAQANSLHAPEDFDGPARSLLVIEDGDTPARFRQFDIVFTNPPFGSKNTKVALAESAQFDLGHKWRKRKDGTHEQTSTTQKTPAQELFIERCLALLKPGGRMAIVLPEIYAHGSTKKHIVQLLSTRATIRAVIDLPRNTFQPHTDIKTLLWIVEKKPHSARDIIMGVAEEIGHDHHGKTKYRIRDGALTGEVWNDMKRIRAEWGQPTSPENGHVWSVPRDTIDDNIFVPRYYRPTTETRLAGHEMVSIDDLIAEGILKWFVGHSPPPNAYKGQGDVPYVRTADIGNWIVYKNPVAAIPRTQYEALRKKKYLRPKDVIFVRDGRKRIGNVGILLPSDTKILLSNHCIVLRVAKKNRYDIDALYLAYLLQHPATQRQVRDRVFIDTSIPSIRARWRTLRLPVSTDPRERARIRAAMTEVYSSRARAEAIIADLNSDQGKS
jgi:type I restriction enzyme M protein